MNRKAVLMVLLVSTVYGCFGQQNHQKQDDEFRIGIFWPPVWEQTNLKQYKVIKKANVDYIQNVLGSLLDTEERNLEMLRLAGECGLEMYVADPRVNGTREEIGAMVNTYRNYPATSGYYVVDEPDIKGMEAAAKKYQTILSFDKQAIPYVNLLPQWAESDYATYVNQWIETCGKENLKYLSFDCYPFMVDGSFRDTYYQNLDVIRLAGLKNSVKTSCYLQSIGIPKVYRRPSEADMRFNVYSSLAYGIKNAVWFTYWTPTGRGEKFTNAIIDSCGNKTDLYVPFQQLNHQMKQLGKTLIGLDAQDVYHTGTTIPAGTERLPSDFIIRPENDNTELLITNFAKKDTSQRYVMVVNRSLERVQVVCFKMGNEVTSLKEISSASGKPQKVKFNQTKHTLNVSLLPGEGKLYKLNLL